MTFGAERRRQTNHQSAADLANYARRRARGGMGAVYARIGHRISSDHVVDVIDAGVADGPRLAVFDARMNGIPVAHRLDVSAGASEHDSPPGVALGSKTVTGLVYTPGACPATGGEAMGEAITVELRTFCCMG